MARFHQITLAAAMSAPIACDPVLDESSGATSSGFSPASSDEGAEAASGVPEGPDCDGYDTIVESQAEVDALYDCTKLRSLSVNPSPGIISVHLPNLVHITGELSVEQAPDLPSLTLPALQRVDASVSIHFNEVLTSVELPLLTEVGAVVAISQNPVLTSVELPALVRTGAFVYARENGALVELDFGALETCGGYFDVSHNASLQSVDLEALLRIEHDVDIIDNPAWCVPALDWVAISGATVDIASNFCN